MSEAQQLLAEAQALAAKGDTAGALARMNALVALDPANATAHFNRGNLLQQARRFEDALAAYDCALALKSNVQIWLNRATALRALDRNADARASFEAALALDPNNIAAHVGRGVILGLEHCHEEALASFDAALALAPNTPVAHHNRGKALYALDRFADAAAAYERALALDPNYASAWNNLGVALEALNRRPESIAAFERAIALRQTQAPDGGDPRLENPLFNLAVAHLRAGDYEEGFRLYEYRFSTGAASRAEYADEAPQWNGERVDGVLRIWAEQGPGDQLLFTRLLPRVLERTPNVALEVDARLIVLLKHAHPDVDVRACDNPARNAAAQIGIGSLPHALGLRRSDLPLHAPLVRAHRDKRERLRAAFAARANGKPIVGVAWASPRAPYAAQKSAPLSAWAPLFKRDGFFVSLQYDALANGIAPPLHFYPDVDQLKDFEMFAAQLAAMDHIVSVSSTLVHLAGAMGLSAQVLVPPGRGLHWYWGLEGAQTPWYPSLRLVRRTLDEPWEAQIARAAENLDAALEGKT